MRPANDVERRPGRSTHRINVRERVGRGNLPVNERIVNNRREKIDRAHQGKVFADKIDASVVSGRDSDQEIGVGFGLKPGQCSLQVRRTQLTGSTRSLASRSEPHQLIARAVVVVALRHCFLTAELLPISFSPTSKPKRTGPRAVRANPIACHLATAAARFHPPPGARSRRASPTRAVNPVWSK